jgi:hypothetical protein
MASPAWISCGETGGDPRRRPRSMGRHPGRIGGPQHPLLGGDGDELG